VGSAVRPDDDRAGSQYRSAWTTGRAVTDGRSTRSLRAVHAAVLVAGAAVTVAVLFVPGATDGRFGPELRLVVEVSALFLALLAALVLALTEREDLGPARDAFIAALLVLAVTNVTFSTLPALFDVRPNVDRGLAFYPWAASRFVAGGLMVAAGFHRPRGGLVRTLIGAFLVLTIVEALILAAGARLPVPVSLVGQGAASRTVVHDPLLLAALLLVPAVMFGIGAWLAARLHARSRIPLFAWLSVAMSVQVFAQIHGILAPAFLGPRVTTMDLFRGSAWLLLAGGAVAQLRHLYRARSRTAQQQAEDLQLQSALLSRQQRLAEREEDFRAVVSHEMATPVAALRAFTHVLGSTGASQDQRQAALEGLRSESQRLAELIERVEELRDVDGAGPICQLRAVAVRPLLEEVRVFAAGLPGRSPVHLDGDDDRIMADPVRLGQLLRNLVGNAVRYSPPGTPVRVIGRRGTDRYTVTVVDQGPGIAPGDRDRVLRRYARGSNATDEPGTGLGLYLASRIAEAHDGDLQLLPGPEGRGTAVVVTLWRAT